MTDQWFDFLAARVQVADPDTRRCGITGLDRLIAIAELKHYLEEMLTDGERSEGPREHGQGPVPDGRAT